MTDQSLVTAVIQNYYAERQKYWPQIIGALYEQKRICRDLIIWNNGALGDFAVKLDYGVRIVNSRANTLLGKFAAAFLAETPYVFYQDNDLVIGPRTIETLLAVARDYPGRIVGTEGVILNRRIGAHPYSQGMGIYDGPTYVDVVKGRCWLAHRSALLPAFKMIMKHGIQPGRSDDILMSLAAGGGIVVRAEYTNLDEEGVGMSHEPQHLEERDQMCVRLMEMKR